MQYGVHILVLLALFVGAAVGALGTALCVAARGKKNTQTGD